MPSSKQLVAAAAAMAVASAAPAQLEARGTAFTVEQVLNPDFKLAAPPAVQVAATHAKYNKNGVPADIAAAAAAAAGSVGANPGDQYDSLYLSPVKVGSQTFQLDFDTGSSDLWVLGSSTTGGSHTRYSPGSTASKQSGESWSISYGDGSSASGDVYSDTVNIGGTQVTGQAVERATRASSSFTSGAGDGLVGLAFDSINTCSPRKCTTFVTNAINQGLPQSVFTASLKYHKAGTYDFGKIDSSKYTGSIAYTSVDSSQGFWGFTPSSYSIGSGAAVSGTNLQGIADTGTTLLYAADSVVSAYYRQVSGATNSATYGGWVFPCSATLPSFSLTVGGRKATVPGQYINYAPANNAGTTCFGGIQSDSGIGFAIYGDIFLKSQFVVFDKGSTRIGFATPTS